MTVLVQIPLEKLQVGQHSAEDYEHIGDWLEAHGIEVHDVELFVERVEGYDCLLSQRMWEETVLIEFHTERDAMLFKLAWL